MKETSSVINRAVALEVPQTQASFFRRPVTQLVLFSLLVASNFLSPEGISIAMLFLVAVAPIAFGMKIPRGVLHAVWPLIVMTFVGLVGFFSREMDDAVKDLWYFGKAILTVIFGYFVMWRVKDIRVVLRLFVLAAVLVSGFHLFRAGMEPSVLKEPIGLIHATIGSGYLISALGVVIILAARRYQLDIFPFQPRLFLNLALLICVLAVIVSFSRTLWISTAVFAMLFLYKSKSRKLRYLALAGLIVTVLMFSMSGLASTLENREDAFGSMMRKIARSLDEIIISDYSGMGSINLHWRGFESHRALEAYKSGSAFEYLFGQGFGTLVDLGFIMPLQEVNMRYVPILHNGYLYLLVKTGLIGLTLYLYYFITLFRQGHRSSGSSDADERCAGFLLMAVSLLLFTTTYAITGLFNKIVLFQATLLLGSLLYLLRNAGMTNNPKQ